jgi:hypothetical protein
MNKNNLIDILDKKILELFELCFTLTKVVRSKYYKVVFSKKHLKIYERDLYGRYNKPVLLSVNLQDKDKANAAILELNKIIKVEELNNRVGCELKSAELLKYELNLKDLAFKLIMLNENLSVTFLDDSIRVFDDDKTPFYQMIFRFLEFEDFYYEDNGQITIQRMRNLIAEYK